LILTISSISVTGVSMRYAGIACDLPTLFTVCTVLHLG
jgi:hypothetical protein